MLSFSFRADCMAKPFTWNKDINKLERDRLLQLFVAQVLGYMT